MNSTHRTVHIPWFHIVVWQLANQFLRFNTDWENYYGVQSRVYTKKNETRAIKNEHLTINDRDTTRKGSSLIKYLLKNIVLDLYSNKMTSPNIHFWDILKFMCLMYK